MKLLYFVRHILVGMIFNAIMHQFLNFIPKKNPTKIATFLLNKTSCRTALANDFKKTNEHWLIVNSYIR